MKAISNRSAGKFSAGVNKKINAAVDNIKINKTQDEVFGRFYRIRYVGCKLGFSIGSISKLVQKPKQTH